MSERALSQALGLAPVRTLAPEERAAAEARNVQWILFFRQAADFQLADWECVPLAEVLAWENQR